MRSLRAIMLAGAALAAPVILPDLCVNAQTVPVDPNGISPYNTHGILDENIQTSTIRNAPALGLSSIYGLNPCSLGASAGVSTPLFGIAGAISTTDKGCETRNTAALAITGLKDEVAAREIMCDIPEFRDAVKRIGKPCLADQQQAANQPSPVASNQLVQPVAARTEVPPEAEAIAPDAPAWCHTAGLVITSYPECTHPATAKQESKQEHKAAQQPKAAKHEVAAPAKPPTDESDQTPDAGSIDGKPPVRATQDTVASAASARRPVRYAVTKGQHQDNVASVCSVRLYVPECATTPRQPTQDVAAAHAWHPVPIPTTHAPVVADATCAVKLYAPGCPGMPAGDKVSTEDRPRLTAER